MYLFEAMGEEIRNWNYCWFVNVCWFLVMDADRWIGMHTLNQKTAKYTVVIDSGHGGVDPGKIGVDGVYERISIWQ